MWVNTIFNYKFKNQLHYCVHFAYLPLLYLLFYLFLKHCLMLSFRCQQDEHCSIQARSWQNCCSGKATTITYYECVFVALVIQHTVRMRPHMWSVRLHSIFPNYPINGTIFEKKLNIKYVFWFCLWRFPETSVITRRTEWDMITNTFMWSAVILVTL